MSDDDETITIGLNLDYAAIAREAAAVNQSLVASLGDGADRAGARIESGLLRAIRSGKLGFDDLKRTALAALAEIAAKSVSDGLTATFGSGKLVSLGTSVLKSLFDLPGRATGGPVSPGAAYVVGERGPELFVPTSAGSIAAAPSAGARAVNVSIAISAPQGGEPQALARSGRQVARAVAAALQQAER